MTAIRSSRNSPAHPDCIHSRGATPVDRLVIHTMEGTLPGSEAWFKRGRAERDGKTPTAAHYLIGRLGDVVQMVPDDRLCYHCGMWNARSIGIEHEARIAPWGVRLRADGSVKPPPYPAGEFPEAMLLASAEVVAILCRKYQIPVDRAHIVGHSEVPGASHTDPGPDWPWDRYVAMVEAAWVRRA